MRNMPHEICQPGLELAAADDQIFLIVRLNPICEGTAADIRRARLGIHAIDGTAADLGSG